MWHDEVGSGSGLSRPISGQGLVAEDLDQLFIREVPEVRVKRADCETTLVRLVKNHYVIDHRAQMLAGAGWADGNGNNQASGTFPGNRFDRGHHGVASGKPIVDQNNLAPFELGAGMLTTVQTKPPADFGTNRPDELLDVRFRQSQPRHEFAIHFNAAVQRHSAQRQFGIFRQNDLSRDNNVEWSFQLQRHCVTYLDSTSWNREQTGVRGAIPQNVS